MADLHLVDDVPGAFVNFVAGRRPASIALSGGSTARDCYVATAATDVDWSATAFWFGDERFVAVTDPDSNEGMARAVWLDAIPGAEVHSMAEAGLDVEAAARNYEAELRAAPALGVVHLGLGPDGHTASLFPGSAALDETERWVVANGDALHPHPRLTLTFAALAVADAIVVTVAGAEKRHALEQVLAGAADLPAARLVTDSELARRTTWLADAAAAG
jgi:6-phosphogluconolactonase